MVLRPNPGIDAREGQERSGLFLITKAGKIDVYGVRAGTPAAKVGIVKGDVILSIDGVAFRSLEQARDALHSATGTVLHLRSPIQTEKYESWRSH